MKRLDSIRGNENNEFVTGNSINKVSSKNNLINVNHFNLNQSNKSNVIPNLNKDN